MNKLTCDKAVVINFTTLETVHERKFMVIFKVLMAVPNKLELEEFYMGTTRRIDKNKGSNFNFEPYTAEELNRQVEQEIDIAIIYLNRKLEKALRDGKAEYVKENTEESGIGLKITEVRELDNGRYSEIEVVTWHTDDTSFVEKTKEMHDKFVEVAMSLRKWDERRSELTPVYLRHVPEESFMQPGKLYISKEYGTASHLCPCGCCKLVVTPIELSENADASNSWVYSEREEGGKMLFSLHSSIGNYNFPCKSHYNITNNQIIWHKN